MCENWISASNTVQDALIVFIHSSNLRMKITQFELILTHSPIEKNTLSHLDFILLCKGLKITHWNSSYLSIFKPHKKSLLSKVYWVKFEFIQHAIVSVCLKIMPTTFKTARESNPLFYPQHRGWSRNVLITQTHGTALN